MKPDKGTPIVAPELADLQLWVTVNGEAFEAPPGKAQPKHLEGVEEGGGRAGLRGLQDQGEETAGTGIVPLPEVVAWRAWKGRIQDLEHLWAGLQPACKRQPCGFMPAETHVEGA